MIKSKYQTIFFIFFIAFGFIFSPIFSEKKKNYKTNHSIKLEEIHRVEKDFEFVLTSRKFFPGELVCLTISSKSKKMKEKDFQIFWKGEEYPLYNLQGKWLSFLPISPEEKPGYILLEVKHGTWYTGKIKKKYEVEIHKSQFIVQERQSITLPQKYVSKTLPKDILEFIKECEKKKLIAFQSDSKIMLEDDFVFPLREKKISSPFYIQRNYNKKKGRPHGGVDFRGKTGNPIFAIQSGKVVLSRPMYFEGVFTVIDHGAKIFSFYMHQSETLVKEGDFVKKGSLIGRVGSTGMSTGPHLHLGMKVRGTLIDPLSAIALKLKALTI
ncbi:MAG: M23 family metallopeptidase [Leptospiraceae bacterium]|nr:M23 family metallopeptidase [Leptospiraceae bacterium]MCK6381316.1 M23 family metallopeptidase [Leptospiraceae bacterium]NUM40795.1 M23 family metallopeptidase [Leptospiraceae bacterium]